MSVYFDWTPERIKHIAEHGVTPAEWEQAYLSPIRLDVSRSSRRDALYGLTEDGRCLWIVYEVDEGDECDWVIPYTGYLSMKY